MDFLVSRGSFETLLGVKKIPNSHEIFLFQRAQKYIRRVSWIPGIRMIAIVNSLSMYATHTGSDIDLFVITAKNRIWIVRTLMTLIFWISGVWRKGEDIAGNFCLSFFITDASLDITSMRIEDDIYLYYWIYFLKPMIDRDDTYRRFLEANGWVDIPAEQQKMNQEYLLKDQGYTWKHFSLVLDPLECILSTLGMRKTLRTYEQKGRPEGIIITRDILKFHDADRRREIRESIRAMDD